MFETEVEQTDEGIKLIVTIKANKDGMVDLGNNTVCHIDTLMEGLKKHGISYISAGVILES